MSQVVEKDLYGLLKQLRVFDTLVDEILKDSNHCNSQSYWRWEERVQKFLESKGYRVERWCNLDFDSFGPLVRGVYINGELYFYG